MAIPSNIERYVDHAGEYRWRYLSDNGHDILADSGDGYKNSDDMEAALDKLWPNDPAVDAALAILCLVTGDDWDRNKLMAQSGQLRDVAHHTLKKQGLTDDDAATFVDERWRKFAADIPQEPEVVPPGVTISTTDQLGGKPISLPSVSDLEDRLADRRARQAY